MDEENTLRLVNTDQMTMIILPVRPWVFTSLIILTDLDCNDETRFGPILVKFKVWGLGCI